MAGKPLPLFPPLPPPSPAAHLRLLYFCRQLVDGAHAAVAPDGRQAVVVALLAVGGAALGYERD